MDTPSDMAAVRHDIDVIDGELIRLLAQRQNLVEVAGRLKQGKSSDAVKAPDRVAQVIADRRHLAEQNDLDPDVAEAVWRAMIEAFIALELRVHGEQ